ncbi:hypothetical protein GALL_490720 [mine drainage metagenome]|uniref:Etoposide-induced protein 2.4 (EI24) n=1 Tax=mine drainage metagenome TaxID=410659 RepID=A0A1J5PDN8_9ZZZZ
MNLLFDSFWRALFYCFRPRVIALTLGPLLLMGLLSLGFGYLYWDMTLNWVHRMLDASTLIGTLSGWMQALGLGQLQAFLGPLMVILAIMPVIVVTALLLVALLMTPALTALVASQRFASLERKNGGSMLASLVWSLFSTLLALLALLVSLPLWLIPPLILVLPPLIWGWLTYRVLAYDALAVHASAEERREIFRRHRVALLSMGVFCGFLGAAPSAIWAAGVLFSLLLVPIGIWFYTMLFALSSLWFAHYGLAALQQLRTERAHSAAAARRMSDHSTTDTQTLPLPLDP